MVLEKFLLMIDSIGRLEKPNMTLLRKGLNEKDKKLKSQLLIVTENDEKTPSENV